MNCKHFGSCGSCGLFDISYEEQLRQNISENVEVREGQTASVQERTGKKKESPEVTEVEELILLEQMLLCIMWRSNFLFSCSQKQ